MTLKEFQPKCLITCDIQYPDDYNLEIVSRADQRKDGKVTDSVKTVFENPATSSRIQDQSTVPLNNWTWEKVINYIKRAQLDFRQRFTIAHELGHYEMHDYEIE